MTGWPSSEYPDRVVLVGPERLLADLDAKRRIVELRYSWNLQAEQMTEPPFGPILQTQVNTADAILRTLALPYAYHPDYEKAVAEESRA
jgi:hypothetical protein